MHIGIVLKRTRIAETESLALYNTIESETINIEKKYFFLDNIVISLIRLKQY